MADVTTNAPTWASTGTPDTATTLVDNVDDVFAKHQNHPNTAIIQLQTILGNALQLKGTLTDLNSRLNVAIANTGKLNTFSSTTKAQFPPQTTEGCLGETTFTASEIIRKHATLSKMESTGLTVGQTGVVATTAGAETLSNKVVGSGWTGLGAILLQGYASTGAGSSYAHEGTVTISSGQNLSGVHYYDDLTINSGITVTIPAGSGRLIIVCTGTCTINGTISGIGGGVPPATPGSAGSAGVAGTAGTDQPGGGGGATDLPHAGGVGGAARPYYTLPTTITAYDQAGGTAAADHNSAGGNATQLTSSPLSVSDLFMACGGASGGTGGFETGTYGTTTGAGGASLVVIAPTIVLGASSAVTLSGAAGRDANDGGGNKRGGEGGGGSGNVYFAAKSYTDNGAVFTLNGGAGGSDAGGAVSQGGSGANGVKYIFLYD